MTLVSLWPTDEKRDTRTQKRDKKRETKVLIRESIQLTRPERHQGAQGEDGADGDPGQCDQHALWQ